MSSAGAAISYDVGFSMADSAVLFILCDLADRGGGCGLFRAWTAQSRGGDSVSASLVSLLVLRDWSRSDVGSSMAESGLVFVLCDWADRGGSRGISGAWTAGGHGGDSVSASLVSLFVLRDWPDRGGSRDFFRAWTAGGCGGDSASASLVSSR